MSDNFMKSALDRAMERADKINVPEEKLKQMKHDSKGKEIAAALLKNPTYDLKSQLEKLDAESKKYVTRRVVTILLQNIILPKKEGDIIQNQDIFKALAAIKSDQNGLKQASEQLTNLSNYYSQTIKQNYDQLKVQVEQALTQATMQKTGAPPQTKPIVERSPEFTENWRQLLTKLDSEYGKALAQLKQQITEMA